jgi:hypothetical protein
MDRDQQNPYAPPVESSAQPPGPAGGLSLSDHGWDIVSSLARWMRIVAVSEWVAAGLLVVGGLIALSLVSRLGSLDSVAPRSGSLMLGAVFVMALLFVVGGVWLRQAAAHFHDGVLADAERPLADGFRKLRLYLILYGVYAIVGLATQIYQLVGRKGG